MRKKLVGCIAAFALSTTMGVASLALPFGGAVNADGVTTWKNKISYDTSQFTLTEDYTAYGQATCFKNANDVKYLDDTGIHQTRLDLGKSGLLLTSKATGANAVGASFNFTKVYTGAFNLDFRVLSEKSFIGNCWTSGHTYNDLTSVGITFTSVSDSTQSFTIYYTAGAALAGNVNVKVAVNDETYNDGNGAAIYKANATALDWSTTGYVLTGNTFCNVGRMETSGVTYHKTKSYPTSLSFDPASMKVHSKQYKLIDLNTKGGFNEYSENWLVRDLSSTSVYQDEVVFGSKWDAGKDKGMSTIDPSVFADGYTVSMSVKGMTHDVENARTAKILLYNVGGEEYRSQTKVTVSEKQTVTGVAGGRTGTGYTFTASTQNEAAENTKIVLDGADFYDASSGYAELAVGAAVENPATAAGATPSGTAYYGLAADGGVSDIAYEYDPYSDVRGLGVTFRSKTDTTKAFTVYLQSRTFKSSNLIARVGIEGENYRNSSGTKGFAVYDTGTGTGVFNGDGQYRGLDGTLGMYANSSSTDSPYTPLRFDPKTMSVYGYADANWYILRNLTKDYAAEYTQVAAGDLATLDASDFAGGYTVEISVEMMNNNWNRGRAWMYNTWGAYLKSADTDGYLLEEGYNRDAKISVFALKGENEEYCFDWDNNGACDACGAFTDGLGAVKGASLSLDGNVGVNFYMDLAKSVVADESAYLSVKYSNKTQNLLVKDAVYNETNGYKFTVNVAAKDADEEIQVQLVSGGINGNVYTYSIMQYAEKLLADETGAYDSYKPVVNALVTYTKYAKANFVAGATAPEVSADMQAVTAETVAAYKMKVEGTDENVELVGYSLVLKSNTTLRLYFKSLGDSVPTVTIGGVKTTVLSKAVGDDTAYYVEITDIAANKLDTEYAIVIGGVTVNCSALSFVETVLTTDGADVATVNLVKALYLYNVAANRCLGD